jgi:hypothetical protein
MYTSFATLKFHDPILILTWFSTSRVLKVKLGIFGILINRYYSQTSIVRGGRGYQISKNFPRIIEVCVVKRSTKFWHPCKAKVTDLML